MKDNQNAITPSQLLYPVILLCVAFLLLMAFQMSQILNDRASLNAMRSQQEKGIEDSQRIQAQLVALIVGTQKLASEGDVHAQKIVEKLKTIGVIPSAPPAPVPPQAGMQPAQPVPTGMVPVQGPTPQQAQSAPPMAVPSTTPVVANPAPGAPTGITEPVAPAPIPVAQPQPGPVKP